MRRFSGDYRHYLEVRQGATFPFRSNQAGCNMLISDTIRQDNALADLKRITEELRLLSINDSFLSGKLPMWSARTALLKLVEVWQSEYDNLRGEV
jgi:hypothetical protein